LGNKNLEEIGSIQHRGEISKINDPEIGDGISKINDPEIVAVLLTDLFLYHNFFIEMRGFE
jgi:hypothetical protein